ncbi:NUDIX hydrolase [Streptomyces bambusae]|uniref:NUDIX domain-containing protein n=1 Tax=Streptomyces bambusae TaxID=1550616 RepID=A0ABS6Z7T0_9ACTN|nr:NUDIX hydrolase [Streptomyces bambusae]MBW5483818.1 NUDIX domain-containing protein [Streptomyces bambusae]
MIVWINGAFGAGKTSTARELTGLLPDSTVYDPELVGGALMRLLPRERADEVSDFQDLPSWRRLVVDAAAALLAELGGTLVVPMTLLRQEYRDEIFGALAARRIPVRHVVLDPGETILRERIAHRAEPGPTPQQNEVRARQWACDHIPAYTEALDGWLGQDALVLDNGHLTPRQTAERVAEAVTSGTAGVCDIVQTPEPTRETVAAGVLLFDEEDRVLLVDPTYKPGWEFPGGVVEAGEAPAQAGMREVAEELGVVLERVPRLLLVDWEPPCHPGYGGLRLLFDGGRLSEPDRAALRLPGPELRAWRFATEPEAAGMLPPNRFERLRWALRARERSTVLNLEAGTPVG